MKLCLPAQQVMLAMAQYSMPTCLLPAVSCQHEGRVRLRRTSSTSLVKYPKQVSQTCMVHPVAPITLCPTATTCNLQACT